MRHAQHVQVHLHVQHVDYVLLHVYHVILHALHVNLHVKHVLLHVLHVLLHGPTCLTWSFTCSYMVDMFFDMFQHVHDIAWILFF